MLEALLEHNNKNGKYLLSTLGREADKKSEYISLTDTGYSQASQRAVSH